jgi:thiamine-phosphate pyrophosphorylase
MRHPFDPTLYLVTDPELVGGRSLLELVGAAVQGGVTLVQLRDKRAGARNLLEQARALQALLAPHGIPLIVNDRVDVAAAAGAGCHVGQSDLPAAAARALLGEQAILGLSIDQPAQIRAVDQHLLDYVAHGPFAATGTKPDAGAPVGVAGLAALRPLTRLPLVAIGGLAAGNAGAAVAAGADGIAVVSAIIAAAEPAAAARRLRQAIALARQGPAA